MKTKIALLTLLLALTSHGQPWAVDVTTPHTNGLGGTYYGDNIVTAFGKVNSNSAWMNTVASNFLAGGVNPTNLVLSSKQLKTYQTNYAYWTGSNFLARVPGLYSWTASGGDDAGNPPGTIPVSLVGSYSGTNAWFAITNGFTTTNWISVSLLTNGASAFGNTLVNPGAASLYSVDHFELLGKTNFYFGQHQRFDTPVDGNDAATKSYADALFANAFNGNFSFSTDTNGTLHLDYVFQNTVGLDIASLLTWISIITNAPGGLNCWFDSTISQTLCVPTNMWFTVAQTNLSAGWQLQSSTNLSLTMGFTGWTNYTSVTNSGLITFTVPIDQTASQRFFRFIRDQSTMATFTMPVTFSSPVTFSTPPSHTSGTLYPSNTWSLVIITNGMRNGDVMTVNSNGLKLVDVWLSNSIPVFKPHW